MQTSTSLRAYKISHAYYFATFCSYILRNKCKSIIRTRTCCPWEKSEERDRQPKGQTDTQTERRRTDTALWHKKKFFIYEDDIQDNNFKYKRCKNQCIHSVFFLCKNEKGYTCDWHIEWVTNWKLIKCKQI